MSSGSKSPDNTVRYPEYWENAHEAILLQAQESLNLALGRSPFGDAVVFNVRDAFFSDGYVIENFPCLWDMFGKFMAGLDVHNLWDQTLTDILSSNAISAAISEQASDLNDDIETNVLPRFHGGMRNINAIQSSAFASGRALIEDTRIKALNKFAAEIRLRAVDLSASMWQSHLEWNKNVILTYAQMFKLYFSVEMDVNAQTMDMRQRDELFDLSLYEYMRSLFGVVSGGQGTVQPSEPSQAVKSVSGAMAGAAIGAQVGGGYGAIIGGVVGLAASFIN